MRFTELFTDFSKGHWGAMGPYKAGRLEDGFWSGVNVWVDDNGFLAPRQAFKPLPISGLPAVDQSVVGIYVPSTNFGAYYVDGGTSKGQVFLFIVYNNPDYDIYIASWSGLACTAALIGSIAGPIDPTESRWRWAEGSSGNTSADIYLGVGTAGVYRITIGAALSLTNVFNPDASIHAVAQFGDRMYAASFDRRIFYSNVADFNTWNETTQYFDVGWGSKIEALVPTRSAMWVIRSDGDHYRISGVPESSLTVQQAGWSLPVQSVELMQYEGTSEMMFANDCESIRSFPAMLYPSGVQSDALRYLAGHTVAEAGDTQYRSKATWSDGENVPAFFAVRSHAIEWSMRVNGAWSQHTTNGDITGYSGTPSDRNAAAATNPTATTVIPGASISTAFNVHRFLIAGQVAGVRAFYAMNLNLSPDGQVGWTAVETVPIYQHDGPGSGPSLISTIRTPIKEHPAGHELRVMSVDVEFESFEAADWDSVEQRSITCIVYALNGSPPQATGGAFSGQEASAVQTWTEPMDTVSSGSAADNRRIRFNFGNQGWGRGYQLHLAFRGVRIRSIAAHVDSDKKDSR